MEQVTEHEAVADEAVHGGVIPSPPAQRPSSIRTASKSCTNFSKPRPSNLIVCASPATWAFELQSSFKSSRIWEYPWYLVAVLSKPRSFSALAKKLITSALRKCSSLDHFASLARLLSSEGSLSKIFT
ncbi:hypothetical protein Z945_537 [Sulfitobacter noctilucae]|nr:hypothetical protein Z945_537 [Sulfitobacter noctilucae]